MTAHAQPQSSLLQRWATYFAERFPPLEYGLALGAFAWATLAYALAVGGGGGMPAAYPLVVGFAVSFLVFLQLRILDEFKDYEEDARYRPYRPVPRGVVTLHGLARLWIICTLIEATLAATISLRAFVVLAAILFYSGLMRAEFFVRTWLKAHALAYMASHMVIVPMIALFVFACSGEPFEARELAAYLAMSYANFCVFEIGRKIYAPREEREGVETYSALWGPGRAMLAWLGAIWVAAGLAAIAAVRAGIGMTFLAPLLVLGVACTAGGLRFLSQLGLAKGSTMRTLSGLWLVGIHLALAAAVALQG